MKAWRYEIVVHPSGEKHNFVWSKHLEYSVALDSFVRFVRDAELLGWANAGWLVELRDVSSGVSMTDRSDRVKPRRE